MHTRSTLVAATLLLAAACGDDANPVDPPTTGSLTITVETTGGLPDPGGYRVTRAGAEALALPANGSVRVDSLAPGAYGFALDEASLYCAVEGGATRTAQVAAGRSASVTFRVRCEPDGLVYTTFQDNILALHIGFPGRGNYVLASGISSARMRVSPDRRHVAYTATLPGTSAAAVFVVDLDSAGIRQVSPAGSPSRLHPAWSPDGTRMVYATPTDIRVLRIGETTETTLWRAPQGTFASMPIWSPDGTRIAFVATRGGTPTRILVTNADGTGERVVTELQLAPYLQIDWSPDGASIAFADQAPGEPQAVHTVNVATGARTRVIGASDRSYRNPTYLRDGRIGVFAQVFPGGAGAGSWIVNANGTGLTQVAVPSPSGNTALFAWQ